MGKGKKKTTESASSNGITDLVKELWQAAVNLRGSIEPADYKRYVLPIIFLRFLSLRYDRRRAEIQSMIDDPESDYFTTDPDAAENRERFPSDFMFQLTAQEFSILKSQIVTSSWGGRRYPPYVFTETSLIQPKNGTIEFRFSYLFQ